MNGNPGTYIAALAFLLALAGFVRSHYVGKGEAERNERYEKRFTELEVWQRLFQKIVEQQALQILHHPTRTELDSLLDAYAVGQLDEDGASQLARMLLDLINDPLAPPNEITIATMFLPIVRTKYRLT